MLRRVFSGIQPSGNGRIHLGNYLGAVQNWVRLQQDPGLESMYSIVDLHALTVGPKPHQLREAVHETAASLLACGINPDKCILFRQSAVKEHSELMWILSCLAPMGRLNLMTQYKAKSGTTPDDQRKLGLFSYPVLMAADVLLYRAQLVPVGNDQTQHLELMRDIADMFNRVYSVDLLRVPEQMETQCSRVMSLGDGTAKMSKSDPSSKNCILMTDTDDQIRSKLKKAKTDSLGAITYDPSRRPEIANLIHLYSDLSGESVESTVTHFAPQSTLTFKLALADACIARIQPIRTAYTRIRADQQYLDTVLHHGADRARIIAHTTMHDIHNAIGLGQ